MTSSVGVTNVVFTIVAIVLLDKVGRRPLLLIGTVGSVLALVGLGVWFQFAAVQQYSILALVFLLFFVASYAVGLGPVFWLMISEIYPLGVRSKAMGVATVANWAANFVVSYFFLQVVGAVGQSVTFWIYAGFGVLAFAFYYSTLLETKDRSLEQIEETSVSTPMRSHNRADETGRNASCSTDGAATVTAADRP